MGKTYKKIPYDNLRKPKGRRQAIVNEARPKAIPPDPYDDIPYDDVCYGPYSLVQTLIDLGLDDEQVEHKLVNKFHMSHQQALTILLWAKK